MNWLREVTRILHRAGIKVSLAPMYGTTKPVVALMLEGVSWAEVEKMIEALSALTPDPSPIYGRGEHGGT